MALQNVTFNVQHGERVGFVGHNGAGKSSLLKTICRIYEPSSGSIVIRGRIAPLLELGAGFNPELSGRENIYLNGAVLGYPKRAMQEIEREIIDFTEMEEFIDTPAKYYSSGMYMKLAFAIATARTPDILILDEIFAGGDASFIERAMARMNRFIEKASIMLFVSHQQSLLESLCDRIIMLDHGRIVADGSTADVLKYYNEWSRGSR
jgi:ABC-type polysaccharide/polyol phosphate transport system ATPase subunit